MIDLVHGKDVERRLAEQVISLTAILDGEEAELARLREQMREIDNRRARIKRAIEALEGVRKASEKSKPAAKAKPKGQHPWTPSEEVVQKVYDAARTLPTPFTENELRKVDVGDGKHLAYQSAKFSLELMRERGIVRKSGQTKMGGVLWDWMPEHEPETPQPEPDPAAAEPVATG